MADAVKRKSFGNALPNNGTSILNNTGSSFLHTQSGAGLHCINSDGFENIPSVLNEPLSKPCNKKKRKVKKHRSVTKPSKKKTQTKYQDDKS